MDEGPIALVVRLIYRRYMPEHVNYHGKLCPRGGEISWVADRAVEPVSGYAAAHSVRSMTSRLMCG